MRKHQGQKSLGDSTTFSSPSQSGATLHQRSTATDNHTQSTKKSVHQGQKHVGKGSRHQGQPGSATITGFGTKPKSGSIAGHKGTMRSGKSTY